MQKQGAGNKNKKSEDDPKAGGRIQIQLIGSIELFEQVDNAKRQNQNQFDGVYRRIRFFISKEMEQHDTHQKNDGGDG